LGSFGTATAAGLTKGSVKKIAAKVVNQKASGLSVAHATSAGTATSATTATTAAGVVDGSITGADLSPGLQVFSSAYTSCTVTPNENFDGTTFSTCTITDPRITAAVANSDAVDVYLNLGNVYPLPYSSLAGGEFSIINYYLTPGKLVLTRSGLDNTPVGLPGLSFRYTITPNAAGAAPTARPAPAAASTVK
ncbi:MAG TPA: hypothetical protein VFI19_06980, partial [Nocardioides sp.]|nr:hypothetical protein [Nocardioides sp.]